MRLPTLKLSQKLPLLLLGTGLVVGLGIGGSNLLIGSSVVEQLSRQKIDLTDRERARQIGDLLAQVASNIGSEAADSNTGANIGLFNTDVMMMGDMSSIRTSYIDGNKTPQDQRLAQDQVGDGSAYDATHVRVQPTYRALMQAQHFADVYLISPAGDVMYSAAKHDDFATNLLSGTYKDGGLARAFNAALKLKPGAPAAFADFAPDAASHGAAHAFLAAPVTDDQGQPVGVYAVAVGPEIFDSAVEVGDSLGASGEALLVNADGYLLHASRFGAPDGVLKTQITGPMVTAATGGTPQVGVLSGYRGITAYAASRPVTADGAHWAVIALEDVTEAGAPLTLMRNMTAAIGGGLLVLALAVGLLFSRSISRPITRLTGAMARLADGDLDAEVKGAGRRDELGAMARAVQVFRDNAIRMAGMTEEERAAALQRRTERTEMMQALQQAFGQVVDAAIAGDFSQRVRADFPDAELNSIASGINTLVETVDRGLADTGEVLAALARTDLTRRMEGNYAGAFAQLQNNTNAVCHRLSEVASQLKTTSRALKTATGEILSGANDLSVRTTRQAATIEETSAMMEQLAATVMKNADTAGGASAAAATVTGSAESGGSVMAQATEAMERITTSSGKISNIIGMIDDIAFQTNLLALNASVEAARAGESGKGFAVVAVEVRRLAQSAAQASREVKVLIDQSAGEVKGGSRLVDEAAARLSAILTAARTSGELIETIARASREQATSIENVNASVRQMDEMTQHNAALVEETNAAIEQTEAQASELDRIVGSFTLAEVAAERSAMPKEIGSAARRTRRATAAPAPPARRLATSGNAAIDPDWSEF